MRSSSSVPCRGMTPPHHAIPLSFHLSRAQPCHPPSPHSPGPVGHRHSSSQRQQQPATTLPVTSSTRQRTPRHAPERARTSSPLVTLVLRLTSPRSSSSTMSPSTPWTSSPARGNAVDDATVADVRRSTVSSRQAHEHVTALFSPQSSPT
jgi:hypothetical protein